MNLSPNFTLEELVSSQTASRLNIDNTPSPEIIERLKMTCTKLEEVRLLLGHPIIVSSGYRSPRLNAAVGGVTTSAHSEGYAADFLCPGFGSPLEVCKKIAASDLKFDQLIREYDNPDPARSGQSGGWTHISFDPRMRRQLLSIFKAAQGYLPGLG